MDMDGIMKKVGDKLNVARDVAMDLADKAGKKAGEVYDAAKLKIKLADIRRDISSLYREIGAAAYNARLSGDDIAAAVAEKCDEVQRLKAEMEELSKQVEEEAEAEAEAADDVIIEAEVSEAEMELEPAEEKAE